jgi:hypothetical protein
MLKRYLDLAFKSRLILESDGRTMLKLPIWLAVLLALDSIKLLVIAAIAVVGLGMRVTVEKGVL